MAGNLGNTGHRYLGASCGWGGWAEAPSVPMHICFYSISENILKSVDWRSRERSEPFWLFSVL